MIYTDHLSIKIYYNFNVTFWQQFWYNYTISPPKENSRTQGGGQWIPLWEILVQRLTLLLFIREVPDSITGSKATLDEIIRSFLSLSKQIVVHIKQATTDLLSRRQTPSFSHLTLYNTSAVKTSLNVKRNYIQTHSRPGAMSRTKQT